MRILIAMAGRPQMKQKNFGANERKPKFDYQELADTLASRDGWHVDMIDARTIELAGPLARQAARRLGIDRVLAMRMLGASYRYDAILSLGDPLAVSVAMGHRLMPRHCRHITTFIYPVSPKKLELDRLTRFSRELDLVLVHTEGERREASAAYRQPIDRFGVLPLQVDHEWYRPSPVAPARLTIGAAGVEYRDYRTLVEAATDLPEARFVLNPQSPWSTKTPDLGSPTPNVEVRTLEMGAIRDFYDELSAVAVPVLANDTAAGMTAVLQGMSMGKPVICTRTPGLAPLVSDGRTGILVAPGDIRGWREAIRALQDDPALAARLGAEARSWIERNATVESWVDGMRAHIRRVVCRPETERSDAGIEGSAARR